MTTRRRIRTNAAYQFASQALALALSFVASPYIVHHLGTSLYGLLILVGITTNYFAIVELGLGQASVKFFAEAYVQADWDGLRRLFWTSIVAYCILSSLGAAAIVGLTPLLLHVLKIPVELNATARHTFLIGAVGLIVSLLAGALAAVPKALERFDVVSKTGFVIGVSQTVLTVFLLYRGFSLVALVVAGVLLQCVVICIYSSFIHSQLPRIGKPVWDLACFKRLLGFGGLVTVSQVAGPLLVHIEKFIMGGALSIAQVTYYTVPYSLAFALSVVPSSLATVLFPALSRLSASDDRRAVAQLTKQSTRYIFMAIFPIALALCICGRELLKVWMGADFADHSSRVLQVLAIALVINAIAAPSFQVLQALGRPDLTAKYHVLELVLHIPLCFFLIPRYGILGGALAWAIRVSIDTALMIGGAVSLTGISSRELLRASMARTAASSAVFLPLLWWGASHVQGDARLPNLLRIAFLSGAYCMAVVLGAFGDTEKTALTQSIRKYWPSASAWVDRFVTRTKAAPATSPPSKD